MNDQYDAYYDRRHNAGRRAADRTPPDGVHIEIHALTVIVGDSERAHQTAQAIVDALKPD